MSYGRTPFYIYSDGASVNFYGLKEEPRKEVGCARVDHAAIRQFLRHWVGRYPSAMTLGELVPLIDEDFPDPPPPVARSWQDELAAVLAPRGWLGWRTSPTMTRKTPDFAQTSILHPLLEQWMQKSRGARSYRIQAAAGDQPALATVEDGDRRYTAAAITDPTSTTEALGRAWTRWAAGDTNERGGK